MLYSCKELVEKILMNNLEWNGVAKGGFILLHLWIGTYQRSSWSIIANRSEINEYLALYIIKFN